jgi:hypothetical protein
VANPRSCLEWAASIAVSPTAAHPLYKRSSQQKTEQRERGGGGLGLGQRPWRGVAKGGMKAQRRGEDEPSLSFRDPPSPTHKTVMLKALSRHATPLLSRSSVRHMSKAVSACPPAARRCRLRMTWRERCRQRFRVGLQPCLEPGLVGPGVVHDRVVARAGGVFVFARVQHATVCRSVA